MSTATPARAGRQCWKCGGTSFKWHSPQEEGVYGGLWSVSRLVLHWWCANCSSAGRAVGYARTLSEEASDRTKELAELLAGCSLEGWTGTDYRRYLSLLHTKAALRFEHERD